MSYLHWDSTKRLEYLHKDEKRKKLRARGGEECAVKVNGTGNTDGLMLLRPRKTPVCYRQGC